MKLDRKMLGQALAAATLAALGGACSSTSSSQGNGETPISADASASADTGIVGCSGEGDTYTANLVKPGKSGKYTFTLVSAMPGPPSLDTNVWQVKVVDGSGKAPSADQLSAYPYMPKMGHGSSQVPRIAASGTDGEFTVSDVYLFMDGLWTVTISVASPPVDGGTPKILDSAVYTFCIDD